MLHFRCAGCNKSLKVPETRAGKKVTCPRCHVPTMAPDAKPRPSLTPDQPVEIPDAPPGFFASMSTGLYVAVVLAAVVGAFGLLAFLAGMLDWTTWFTPYGLVVAVCSVVALLVMLYGHGTGCPACGAWWSRILVSTEVAEREVFHRDGATFGRSMTRTQFRCNSCDHNWTVTDAEEYPEPERTTPRKPNNTRHPGVQDGGVGREETGAKRPPK
jgi:DNA-directed RNA polymerase subunit RPC12/RpoP